MASQIDNEKFDKDAFLKALGLQIRAIREDKGITASEFGRRADMERSHVARLEAGGTNPTSTTLKAICDGLDIEMYQLFDGFKG